MAITTRKIFVFNPAEMDRLHDLQERLDLPSEADVVRFGLAAIDGILQNGLRGIECGRVRIDDAIRRSFIDLPVPDPDIHAEQAEQ
jgi:hypothetical protein